VLEATIRAEAGAAFADGQIARVAGGKRGQVTRGARDVSIAAQDRVECERLSQRAPVA
jgi:hypothetical protein